MDDICGLIGVLLTIGYLQQNLVDATIRWSWQHGLPVLKATMSLRGFKDFMVVMHFDDKASQESRKAKDKFATIGDV
jgi:hypothetical protein